MAWPPTTHQDVQDEVTRLRGVINGPAASGDTTGATDTAAINAALAANASVVLPAGRYWLNDSLQIAKSYALFRGQGRATELVLADGFAWNKSAIKLATPSVDKVTISDLAIHGRRFGGSGLPQVGYAENQDGITLDNTGGTGVSNSDTNHRIERVFVREMHGKGIVLLCSTGAIEQRGTHLIGCEVYDTFGNGIHLDGPTDNTIVDCTVGGPSSHGFYLIRTANNKVVASKAFYGGALDATVYANWYVSGPRNVFAGCESQDAYGNGVWFLQADNSWDGIVDNSTRGASSGTATAGVRVESAAVRCFVRASAPNYEGLQKRDVILNAPATVVLTSVPLTATHVAYIDGDATAIAASAITVNNVPRVPSGATAARPATDQVATGAMFFDTTLNKPIWRSGSTWRDATGATV